MWLYPLLAMGAFGCAFGAGLAYASKKFAVETDPRVTDITGALPGANCGGCGFPGCGGYADAVVTGKAAPNLCTPGGAETVSKIAAVMGVNATMGERHVAFIRCQGAATSQKEATYSGVQSCALAALVGEGPLACKNACLLLGDCAFVCQFGAMSWEPGNVPVINYDKCTACRKCITACPKELITLTPESKRVAVVCRSQDKGGVARKKCSVACIACTKCVQTCPVKAISMDGNVAVINPETCTMCGTCIEACPTKAILDLQPVAQRA